MAITCIFLSTPSLAPMRSTAPSHGHPPPPSTIHSRRLRSPPRHHRLDHRASHNRPSRRRVPLPRHRRRLRLPRSRRLPHPRRAVPPAPPAGCCEAFVLRHRVAAVAGGGEGRVRVPGEERSRIYSGDPLRDEKRGCGRVESGFGERFRCRSDFAARGLFDCSDLRHWIWN